MNNYLSAKNLGVQMKQAVDGRDGQAQQLAVTEHVKVQEVVQRPQRVVMSNEPELSDRVSRCHVRADVAKNALVAEQYGAETAV